MPALLAYLSDLDNDQVAFAVVADDTGAEYVTRDPRQAEVLGDPDRINSVVEALGGDDGGAQPQTAVDWLNVYAANMLYDIELHEVGSRKDGVEQATAYLAEDDAPGELNKNFAADYHGDAWDQVTLDYPMLAESLESTDALTLDDANGVTNLVMMTLGPQSPDGDNGWLFRQAFEEPAWPGDDQGYVQFVGSASQPLPPDGKAAK